MGMGMMAAQAEAPGVAIPAAMAEALTVGQAAVPGAGWMVVPVAATVLVGLEAELVETMVAEAVTVEVVMVTPATGTTPMIAPSGPIRTSMTYRA